MLRYKLVKKIIIKYNPYEMNSKIIVDNKEIHKNKHCDPNLKKYLNEGSHIPLQHWIDPILYDGWEGLLNVLCDNFGKELKIEFSGRKVDFEDLKKSILTQNETKNLNARIEFCLKDELLSDQEMNRIIREILSDDFQNSLISLESQELLNKYYNFKKVSDNIIREKFRIVFIGTPNSGESVVMNTLIKKEILPSNIDKICNIFHDSKIKSLAKIKYLESVYDCNNLEEIKGIIEKIEGNNKEVEIYSDLSTLFSNENNGDFELVITYVPNLYSKTNDFLKLKSDMYIVISDEKVTDRIDDELIDAIKDLSGKSPEKLPPSFLFVINNCESLMYSNQFESLENKITDFVNNINKRINLTKNKRFLIPKVFPISVNSASAILQESMKNRSANNQLKYSEELYIKYQEFCKKLYNCSIEDLQKKSVPDIEDIITIYSNYHNFSLEKYASSSELVKYNFNKNLRNELSVQDRIMIHTGVPSLQISIKDYFTRYSYCVKVAKLVEYIADIYTEISIFNKKENERLTGLKKQFLLIESLFENRKDKLNFEDSFKKIKNELSEIRSRIIQLNEIPPKIEKDFFVINEQNYNFVSEIKNIFIDKKNKLGIIDLYTELIKYLKKFEEIGILSSKQFLLEDRVSQINYELKNVTVLLEDYMKDMGIVKKSESFLTESFLSDLIIKGVNDVIKNIPPIKEEERIHEYIKKLEEVYSTDIQLFKFDAEKRLSEVLNQIEEINRNYKRLTTINKILEITKKINTNLVLLKSGVY